MVFNSYKLNEVINSLKYSKNSFIIANEILNKSGNVIRYYTLFPSFNSFLKNRIKYEHCHEIIVDNIQKDQDKFGRLVFDFDIKPDGKKFSSSMLKQLKNFKNQIENTIFEVIDRYCINIDTTNIEFIWSQTQHLQKFSRHLTVKNLYFNDWIILSKIFYNLFNIIWDEKYHWINSKDLIDIQIIRKHASLRMVGSSKIGGNVLVFDNENHKLVDSLIRIYNKKKEQIITINNFINNVFINVIEKPIFKFSNHVIEEPIFDIIIYQKAFELYNSFDIDIFRMGSINGSFLTLLRNKPYRCLLSNKIHYHENSFCTISYHDNKYIVKFGCFRFCSKKKTVYVGYITNLKII